MAQTSSTLGRFSHGVLRRLAAVPTCKEGSTKWKKPGTKGRPPSPMVAGGLALAGKPGAAPPPAAVRTSAAGEGNSRVSSRAPDPGARACPGQRLRQHRERDRPPQTRRPGTSASTNDPATAPGSTVDHRPVKASPPGRSFAFGPYGGGFPGPGPFHPTAPRVPSGRVPTPGAVTTAVRNAFP